MLRLSLLLILIASALSASAQKQITQDQRMGWWREGRFGLFIHWGLYSIPAGKWGDKDIYGEWIRESAHIPVGTYEKFQPQFNPTRFNADQWVAMAKDAGMKYIVITTKHHDGFNLFRSKYSDWDVSHTPFQRDIMREMAEATRKAGLNMGWYHSIMDWHHPDYLPRRAWEVKDRPEGNADFARYEKYLHDEVQQLLTDYGPIGVMWFDGQWEGTWNAKRGRALFDLCRKLQPNVIVNDRVSSGLPAIGDYTTPEQFIPDTGIPGQDWETCMTMNGNWGYNAADHDWKSSASLIRNLVDIVSKGGNYLLNVGPTADGEFPPEAVQRLKEIGAWMHVNGDSIYGTEASVFEGLPWGRSTTKRDGSNTKLYLQVFDWPKDGRLVVPAIGNDALGARLLGSNAELSVSREGQNLVVAVPASAPSDVCSTIELRVAGSPLVYRAPKIHMDSEMLVHSATITMSPGSEGLAIRYTTDGSDPTAESPLYSAPKKVSDSTQFKAASFAGSKIVSSVVAAKIEKVSVWPSASVGRLKRGWVVKEFKGDWDTMPDFKSLDPRASFSAAKLGVPLVNKMPEELVGRVFSGYLDAKSDDVYQFALTSDDGSRLWIDGRLVVDNDGLHGAVRKLGAAPLAKGRHAVTVEWFNKTGDASVLVDWGHPGGRLAKLEVGNPKVAK